MNLLKSVVKFVSDATPVSKLDELEEGRAAVDGVVRIGDEGEIVSPVNGRPCVAFYYNAFAITGMRQGGYMPRKVKSAEVYGPFVLEMEGGRIRAIPVKSDSFGGEDHRKLSGEGHENFKATEELISPGARIRLWGKAMREDDDMVFHYRKVEVLSQAPTSEASSGRKKKKGMRSSR